MTILNFKKDSSRFVFICSIALMSCGEFAYAAKAALGPIYAAGLVYKKHIKDSAEKVDNKNGPVIFAKNMRSLVLAEKSVNVSIPTQAQIYSELEKLESGLSAKPFSFILETESEPRSITHSTSPTTAPSLRRSSAER